MQASYEQLYLDLMSAIRDRLDVIDRLASTTGADFARAEAAAFHGRKIVEGIAFACLVATEKGLKGHCAMCRKAHGAAFATYGRVERTDFAVVSGDEDIASYRSSPAVIRTFCKRCGSNLQFISDKRPSTFALAFGTLDDDPGVQASLHIFVASKAPWFRITDDLPQHAVRETC